jgi:hypothetical protein
MEQTFSENLQLGQLVANALSEIERLGYSRRSRNRYRAIWNISSNYRPRLTNGMVLHSNLQPHSPPWTGSRTPRALPTQLLAPAQLRQT